MKNMLLDESMLNIAGILHDTLVNGPGRRCLIMFQGCHFNCPGCFNPTLQEFRKKMLITPEELFRKVIDIKGIEGVTLSGGEPMLQAKGIVEFLAILREKSSLSVIVFSGFTRREIEKQETGRELLDLIDVLIDGRYLQDQKIQHFLKGSSNQKFHFLTNRYTKDELKCDSDAEIHILPCGEVIATGFGFHVDI